MSRRQGRPQGRSAGTGAKRRPLTTTDTTNQQNKQHPPARAGLQANRAARSAAHLSQFGTRVRCTEVGRGSADMDVCPAQASPRYRWSAIRRFCALDDRGLSRSSVRPKLTASDLAAESDPARPLAGPDRYCSSVFVLLVLSRRCETRRVGRRLLIETATLAVGLLPRWRVATGVFTVPRCDLRGRRASGGHNSSDGHCCREKCGNTSASHAMPP
jgi:hypothetical protein